MPDDPWAEFRVGATSVAQPAQQPTVIYGAPKQRDVPSGYEPDGSGGLRPTPGGPADPNRKDPPSGYRWGAGGSLEAIPGGPAAKDGETDGTVDERKIATLLTRIAGGASDIAQITAKDPDAAAPGLIETLRGDLMPGGVGGTITRGIAGADRRSVHDAQRDVLDALLTLGTGAAYNDEQLSGQIASYFPQYGDTAQESQMKTQRLQRLIEAAKANAGPAWDKVAPAIAPFMHSLSAGDGSEDPHHWSMADTVAKWGEEIYDEKGNPLGPDGGGGYSKTGEYLGLVGSVTATDTPSQYDREVADKAALYDKNLGPSSLTQQGLMMELGDEASGVGGAIAGLLKGDTGIAHNYQVSRDAERLRLDQQRDREGALGTAKEFIGGLSSGGSNIVKAAMTPTQAFRQGALVGGVSGYGSGEGFEGSAANAFAGSAFGGTLGYVGGKAGEALGARAANRSVAQSQEAARVQALSDAGQAEGVTVNRAMADPSLANRVTGVDASLVGGPRIQKGMGEIEGQVEARVGDLGRGGKPLNEEEMGNTLRGAAEEIIDSTGKKAKVKYDRAERLAGDAKVTPTQSLASADQMIAQLSETPGVNSAEIAYLKTLRSDLSKDLSVGALRRMRTKLRKTISKGELTFGEDEARVLEIMNTAADDIRSGLIAQGKEGAARAFDAADKAYRARMDYINSTIQKVIGRRNANKSAEDIARTFSSLARGKDAASLRKFYAALDPDEAADVAATFAEELGKDRAGQFSVSHFLTQSEKLSDGALKTIFGKQGAESVRNLRLLGDEVKRVTGAMNSRKSGTAVANDYRSWLFNTVLGSVPGVATGNTTGALAGAGTVAAAKATRDILSARALLSPKLTKWISAAPRTQNPAAINAHFARLGEIARLEPALAPEIEAMRASIMQAANDNAGRIGSVTASPEQRPDEQ